MSTAEAVAAAGGERMPGGGWIAPCRAHDDREPRLSVRRTDARKVLVHHQTDHAGPRVRGALRARAPPGRASGHRGRASGR